MTDQLFPVPEQAKRNSHLTKEQYEAMYQASVENPDAFWAEQAETLSWFKAPTKIKNTSFDKNDLYIKWFEDGELNVSVNCIDRHLENRADQAAIIWEGDDPENQPDRHLSGVV